MRSATSEVMPIETTVSSPCQVPVPLFHLSRRPHPVRDVRPTREAWSRKAPPASLVGNPMDVGIRNPAALGADRGLFMRTAERGTEPPSETRPAQGFCMRSVALSRVFARAPVGAGCVRPTT